MNLDAAAGCLIRPRIHSKDRWRKTTLSLISHSIVLSATDTYTQSAGAQSAYQYTYRTCCSFASDNLIRKDQKVSEARNYFKMIRKTILEQTLRGRKMILIALWLHAKCWQSHRALVSYFYNILIFFERSGREVKTNNKKMKWNLIASRAGIRATYRCDTRFDGKRAVCGVSRCVAFGYLRVLLRHARLLPPPHSS